MLSLAHVYTCINFSTAHIRVGMGKIQPLRLFEFLGILYLSKLKLLLCKLCKYID